MHKKPRCTGNCHATAGTRRARTYPTVRVYVQHNRQPQQQKGATKRAWPVNKRLAASSASRFVDREPLPQENTYKKARRSENKNKHTTVTVYNRKIEKEDNTSERKRIIPQRSTPPRDCSRADARLPCPVPRQSSSIQQRLPLPPPPPPPQPRGPPVDVVNPAGTTWENA